MKAASDPYFDREYFTLHPGKLAYYKIIIRLILDRLGPLLPRRILDVGSGYGFLLSLLEQEGIETDGIELSPSAAEHSRSICRAPIAVQSAEQPFPYPDGRFGAVVLNDTVEHLREYDRCLREAHRVLAPGGVLFVQTLNANSLARALLGRRWSWYQDPTHVHMLTPRILCAHLRQAGFRVECARTFFNFCQVGESTRGLRWLRCVRRMVHFPGIGDSFYVIARRS